MNKKRESVWQYGVLLLLLVAVDQGIKMGIKETLQVGESKDIVQGFFSLTYVQNFGAAFGMLQNRKIFFLGIGFITIGVLFNMFFKNKDIWTKVGICMVISGAIGNMIDRIWHGYVIDMFDFHGIWQYIFNFADVCVVLGVTILCIRILLIEEK